MRAAFVYDDDDLYETETVRAPQATRKEHVYRARCQERPSRVKFANDSRHERRTSGANGAHRRRFNKAA
jgi:hypothetical protein